MKKPNEQQQEKIKTIIQEVNAANAKLNAYLSAVADGLMLEGNSTFDPEKMEFISEKETSEKNIQNGTSKK